MKALACLLALIIGVLLASCAATKSGTNPQVLSGPQASVTITLPAGTAPLAQARSLSNYAEFVTETWNLGKSLGLTVLIGSWEIDLSRGPEAYIEERLVGLRETYENPQMRWIGSAHVAGEPRPIFELKDGTGDDCIFCIIPIRRGSVDVSLRGTGNDDVSQHAPFLKQLLAGVLIREK